MSEVEKIEKEYLEIKEEINRDLKKSFEVIINSIRRDYALFQAGIVKCKTTNLTETFVIHFGYCFNSLGVKMSMLNMHWNSKVLKKYVRRDTNKEEYFLIEDLLHQTEGKGEFWLLLTNDCLSKFKRDIENSYHDVVDRLPFSLKITFGDIISPLKGGMSAHLKVRFECNYGITGKEGLLEEEYAEWMRRHKKIKKVKKWLFFTERVTSYPPVSFEEWLLQRDNNLHSTPLVKMEDY